MIKTLITSFGMSGRVFHGPLIDSHSRFQLSGFVQRNGRSAQEKYPGAQVFSSLEAALEGLKPDLVVVNTPPFLHEREAMLALEAGAHVVVEKPFAPSLESTNRLLKKASDSNRMITCFQNRRWDSDFLTLSAVVQQKLGALYGFESHFDRFRPKVDLSSWKEQAHEGAGLVWNLGPHLVDQALVLLGMPDWIKSTVRKQREHSLVDDFFSIQLGYASFMAELKASYLVPDNRLKYRVHGEKGSFVKHGMDVQEPQLQNGMNPALDPAYGVEPEQQAGIFYDHDLNQNLVPNQRGNYLRFYDQVADAILHGKEAPVGPTEIRQVIEVLEAAYLSSAENRTVFFTH